MTWWFMFVIVTWIWSCCVSLVAVTTNTIVVDNINTTIVWNLNWVKSIYGYIQAALYWTTIWRLQMTASFCYPDALPGSLLLIQANSLHCCCWVFHYYIAVCHVWLCLGWAEVSTLILTGLRLPQFFISKFHNIWKSSIPAILLTNTKANRNHSVLGEFIFIQSWSSSQLYEANLCFLQVSDFSLRSRRPILIIIISRDSRFAKSLSHWQIMYIYMYIYINTSVGCPKYVGLAPERDLLEDL